MVLVGQRTKTLKCSNENNIAMPHGRSKNRPEREEAIKHSAFVLGWSRCYSTSSPSVSGMGKKKTKRVDQGKRRKIEEDRSQRRSRRAEEPNQTLSRTVKQPRSGEPRIWLSLKYSKEEMGGARNVRRNRGEPQPALLLLNPRKVLCAGRTAGKGKLRMEGEKNPRSPT